MKRIRFTGSGRIMAVAVLVLAFGGLARAADVLEQVPADALMVVKINNLKGVSDKLAKFANDLGLAAMPGVGQVLQDPLGAFQQHTKMSAGLDTAGEAAVVFLDPEQFGGDDEQAMVLLLPVTDYQAFMGNWPEAKPDGEATEVTIEGAPQPFFVAQRGQYAVMGHGKDAVTQQVTAKMAIPPAAAKQLADKDAVLFANFKAIAPKVLPKMAEGREQMLQQMEREIANDPDSAKFAPVIKAFANQFFNGFEAFVRDSQAATVGVSFTNEGLSFTALAEFEPTSYLGQTVSGAKNSTEHMLTGLPAGKYLVFGGSRSDPQMGQKCLDDFAQPILKEFLAMGPDYQAAQAYYDALKDYIGANTGSSFGLLAPTGAIGAESLIQGVSVQQGDAQKMADAYKRMSVAQDELMKAFAKAGGPEAEQVKVQSSYTPNAKTIDGVSFDAVRSDFQVDVNNPGATQIEGAMKMFWGPEGATALIGIVDGQMITAMGVKDETISQVIGAVRNKNAPLAELPGVKAVSANLPQNHLAVIYVPVDEVVNTGLTYAKQFGFGIPIQLPPDLPPVGASMSTEGTAFRMDAYVPTQLVQSLVAAGIQAQMQMQGGRGGGGGL